MQIRVAGTILGETADGAVVVPAAVDYVVVDGARRELRGTARAHERQRTPTAAGGKAVAADAAGADREEVDRRGRNLRRPATFFRDPEEVDRPVATMQVPPALRRLAGVQGDWAAGQRPRVKRRARRRRDRGPGSDGGD